MVMPQEILLHLGLLEIQLNIIEDANSGVDLDYDID